MEKRTVSASKGMAIINNHFMEIGDGLVVEGVLIDSAFLYDAVYNNQKYDFMVLLEQYETTNSSNYLMIASNSLEDIEDYQDMFYKEQDIQDIASDIHYNNTLEYLEETGRIPLEQVDYDIDNFIEALERETNKKYRVYNDLKGQYIALV